ncbi:hypothetical protein GCM10022297_13980 [Lactobacillus hamsteri]|uniref:Uncharacterized protein n=1 Tax=Lactobacillus hamsteri DSM 5661 = JCM 6256 TaxID=1423754 RepID=A0A0R1YAI4_9LACO|nr:hypothetical protein [Lactobacillus hamsteri]KRM37796.1 hypothetical protein FC39_GL001731 [Lactobacillus hamsteri DSM 5661 = JCM 6256]
MSKKEIKIRGIISGILFALLSLGFDYLSKHTISTFSLVMNIFEGIAFAFFMVWFMNGFSKKKDSKENMGKIVLRL